MDLISYNVNGFPWIPSPIKDIVSWIVQTSSVAALQEIWTNHSAWSAAFAAHGWVFLRPAREQHFASLFGSGLAVAWDPKRFSLQEARFYPFLASLDILLVRGWFQVELMAPSGKAVRIVNTHMQAEIEVFTKRYSDVARKQQARQLFTSLKQQPSKPTLIVGDMGTDISALDRIGHGVSLKSHRVFSDKTTLWSFQIG